MSPTRRLRVGDRVCSVEPDGTVNRDDRGVVAEVPRRRNPRGLCIIVWDTGHVDEYTRAGLLDDRTSDHQRVVARGPHWSRAQAKKWLQLAIAGDLDLPADRHRWKNRIWRWR